MSAVRLQKPCLCNGLISYYRIQKYRNRRYLSTNYKKNNNYQKEYYWNDIDFIGFFY